MRVASARITGYRSREDTSGRINATTTEPFADVLDFVFESGNLRKRIIYIIVLNFHQKNIVVKFVK